MSDPMPQRRTAEIQKLLAELEPLLLGFVDSADHVAPADLTSPKLGDPVPRSEHSPHREPGQHDRRYGALMNHGPPEELQRSLAVEMPIEGRGNAGVVRMVDQVLQHSANTWHQGFMSKLYASTNAVGVASELLLAFLNTNVHTYSVSPVLSVIEKAVAKSLARLFGFNGVHAGGITQPGGSASNLTALVVARNSMFPEVKTEGVTAKLVLFTSAHGHYSFEKAAQICGLGSSAVVSVPVDPRGRMIPDELEKAIANARLDGRAPFFVNATAGTTVLGSYDDLPGIGQICKQQGLWFHVDASWGGPAIFSPTHKYKLKGSELADSLTVNPHKMMGVPITCSFLLGQDLQRFWRSNTLPAPYLFHNPDSPGDGGSADIWDLADLTLQCGRKGDAVKLALGWQYYGSRGYADRIDRAFAVAAHLAQLVDENKQLELVSERPPPCLQVCFYLAPHGMAERDGHANSRRTRAIAHALVRRDFHVDFAPGDRGLFLRVVCSLETRLETANRIVENTVDLLNTLDDS